MPALLHGAAARDRDGGNVSWICPWCGHENDHALPESRGTVECWYCHKNVPSKENFRKFRREKIKKLEDEKEALEDQIYALECQIYELNEASFDREKVRHITRDQQKLPFEVLV